MTPRALIPALLCLGLFGAGCQIPQTGAAEAPEDGEEVAAATEEGTIIEDTGDAIVVTENADIPVTAAYWPEYGPTILERITGQTVENWTQEEAGLVDPPAPDAGMGEFPGDMGMDPGMGEFPPDMGMEDPGAGDPSTPDSAFEELFEGDGGTTGAPSPVPTRPSTGSSTPPGLNRPNSGGNRTAWPRNGSGRQSTPTPRADRPATTPRNPSGGNRGGGTVAGGPSVRNGAATLKFALNKGITHKYAMNINQSVTMSGRMPGGGSTPEPMSSKIAVSQTVKVTEGSGNSGTVAITAGKPQMTVNGKAQEGGGPEGGTTTLKVDSRGNVSGERGGMAGAFGGLESIGLMGLIYPSKAVRIGESWSSTVDMSKLNTPLGGMPGETTWKNSGLKATYTLKSINEGAGTADISFRYAGAPKITFKLPNMGNRGGGGGGQMPREMSIDLKLNTTGTIRVSLKDGFPISVNAKGGVETGGIMGMGQKQSVTVSMKRA